MKKIIKKIFFISFFKPTVGLEPTFISQTSCLLIQPPTVTVVTIRGDFSSHLLGVSFGSRFRICSVYFSQLSDLNRLPARYEGAALPGELSWRILKIILLRLFRILCQRCVLNLQCCLLLCNFQIFLVCVFLQVY